MWLSLFKVYDYYHYLEYYDLVNVSLKTIVASHSNTQVAVTFTINTEQVTTQQ